jgi:hypothetical protein
VRAFILPNVVRPLSALRSLCALLEGTRDNSDGKAVHSPEDRGVLIQSPAPQDHEWTPNAAATRLPSEYGQLS